MTKNATNTSAQDEIQTLLTNFEKDWNKGHIKKACSSYAPDATYFSLSSGKIIRGREDIIQHYLQGYPSKEERGMLTLKIQEIREISIRVSPDDENEPFITATTMATAILKWTLHVGNKKTTGYAMEAYIRNASGTLETVQDFS